MPKTDLRKRIEPAKRKYRVSGRALLQGSYHASTVVIAEDENLARSAARSDLLQEAYDSIDNMNFDEEITEVEVEDLGEVAIPTPRNPLRNVPPGFNFSSMMAVPLNVPTTYADIASTREAMDTLVDESDEDEDEPTEALTF